MAAVPTDSTSRRFAAACGVLSQYVRAGAPATITTTPAAAAPLLMAPAAGAASLQLEAGTTANVAPQQLTILYRGRLVVLDACPPEKAAELIRLAAAAAAQGAPAPEAPPALVDAPIARKASLRRFLAKRKGSSSSTSSAAAAYDRQDDEEEQPAAKRGKVVATGEEASPSCSWLALGLGGLQGGMFGR